MYLFFESEVDGLPIKWNSNHRKIRKPQMIRLTWGVFDKEGKVIKLEDHLIHSERPLLIQTKKITGITDQRLHLHGESSRVVMKKFFYDLIMAKNVVSYNMNFEYSMLEYMCDVDLLETFIEGKKIICLKKRAKMVESTLSGKKTHYMSLTQLYYSLFRKPCNLSLTPFSEVIVMAECYFLSKRMLK